MKLLGFQASNKKGKKIDAILEDKDGKKKTVSFGQKGSTTYTNRTGISVDRVHGDDKLRKAYLARHKGEDKKKYSAGYFSIKYLW
jgi:hypothetical protein